VLLLRRREVLLPTPAGWLLLVVLTTALAITVGRSLPAFLTVDEPARGRDGRGAQTLVVEGWLEAGDLDQAAATLRGAHYQRVLTTGGPIESWNDTPRWNDYASRAADYLTLRAPGGPPVIAVPAPPTERDRTFQSALQVAAWARAAGVELSAIDVYSAGIHTRRSRSVYRLALAPAIEVGVRAAPNPDSIRRWWTNSRGAKAVVGEALGVVWTACCFWPDRPASVDRSSRSP
jgi:hypothetical protein